MVKITNMDYMTQESFTVNLEATTIEIPEKDVGQINVLVATPYNEDSLGVYEIELEIKSIKEELDTGYTVPQSFTLTTRIRTEDGSPSGPGLPGAPSDEIDGSDEDEEESDNGFELDLMMMLIIGLVIIVVVGFVLWRIAVSTEE